MGKEYHKKFKDFLLVLVQTMVIAGVVIIAVVPLSVDGGNETDTLSVIGLVY